jgi:hypothetical protein
VPVLCNPLRILASVFLLIQRCKSRRLRSKRTQFHPKCSLQAQVCYLLKLVQLVLPWEVFLWGLSARWFYGNNLIKLLDWLLLGRGLDLIDTASWQPAHWGIDIYNTVQVWIVIEQKHWRLLFLLMCRFRHYLMIIENKYLRCFGCRITLAIILDLLLSKHQAMIRVLIVLLAL